MITHRIWQIAIYIIVIYVAAKIVVAYVGPLLPLILGALALFGIVTIIYYRKRSW